jgi:hypothetical protein
VLIRLMHGGRRWIETNPPITVYKGRDGRRSGVIAIPEEEVERSRPTALEGSARVQALEVGEAMVLELSLPKLGGHVLSQ